MHSVLAGEFKVSQHLGRSRNVLLLPTVPQKVRARFFSAQERACWLGISMFIFSSSNMIQKLSNDPATICGQTEYPIAGHSFSKLHAFLVTVYVYMYGGVFYSVPFMLQYELQRPKWTHTRGNAGTPGVKVMGSLYRGVAGNNENNKKFSGLYFHLDPC